MLTSKGNLATMAKRIPVNLVLLLTSFMVGACSSEPEASSPEQARAESRIVSSDVLRFTHEENGRRQSLEVRKRDEGALDVAISVAGACSRGEAGPAKAVKAEGDVEVEVDPEGEGHPTDAFVLTSRDKCRITIGLAAPERDYAWLRESDCATGCPLSNEAMTRR